MTAEQFIAVMSALAEHVSPEDRARAARSIAERARPASAELDDAARRRRELEHGWELAEIGDDAADDFRARRA